MFGGVGVAVGENPGAFFPCMGYNCSNGIVEGAGAGLDGGGGGDGIGMCGAVEGMRGMGGI